MFYDANDASNPSVVLDRSGKGNDGQLLSSQDPSNCLTGTCSPATYSEDGGGRTGQLGDRAIDFGGIQDGAYLDVSTAAGGAFRSILENEAATISFWAFGGEQLPDRNFAFYFADGDVSSGASFEGDVKLDTLRFASAGAITFDSGVATFDNVVLVSSDVEFRQGSAIALTLQSPTDAKLMVDGALRILDAQLDVTLEFELAAGDNLTLIDATEGIEGDRAILLRHCQRSATELSTN